MVPSVSHLGSVFHLSIPRTVGQCKMPHAWHGVASAEVGRCGEHSRWPLIEGKVGLCSGDPDSDAETRRQRTGEPTPQTQAEAPGKTTPPLPSPPSGIQAPLPQSWLRVAS